MQWRGFLEGLTRKAGQYLGFSEAKLTTRLQGLSTSGRRAPSGETTTSQFSGAITNVNNTDHPSDYPDPSHVGNLLIILNRGYKGGEIAVGCGEREVLFDPASASEDRFFVTRCATPIPIPISFPRSHLD